ncbi:D-amino-acid dehydrogenase [Sphingomonas jinjuensis]|uniref:D-amino-acid dehydrogenase n=1 Tax=Sphingomonas jinjuensis TaxID=535907 RepID=A0A840FIE4_9SPHN|nr:FAD-binding oxidoreductase [Sphingomonas jinjuensis]MBB4153728.1 D-amino-acid dehydrogenase [Sphingomonas jinjuensis]
MADIGIIGGGVVGLASGVALAQAGHAVTVFERHPDRRAASWNNAGHIAVEQVAPLASPASVRSAWGRRFSVGGALDMPVAMARHWLPFAPRFLAASRPTSFRRGSAALGALLSEAMPAWRRLATAIDAPELLREEGHLVAWESPETAARGEAAWRAAETGDATVEPASAGDLERIAAVCAAPVASAIRFDGSGHISDLTALAAALERALVEAGGRLVRQEARLSVVGGQARIAGHDVGRVLIAAGIASAPLAAVAGHRAPLIAERGYHIRAAADCWPDDVPPLVFEDRSMIVTRYADSVQAASFVELGSADAPPDPRKWQRLEAHVAALGLAMAPPFTRWMGSRPTLPDYLPAIGRSSRVGNLFYAFGHQHLGLTLAAVTAEIIAALVAEEAPAVSIEPFRIERFG